MDRIRWGILSTAKIGTQKVIPAMQTSDYGSVAAIASRDLAKSTAAARELSIETAYGSYEELLEDPSIDAVYIPLPNHMHVAWSIQALGAGKHVLCEKPIGLSAAEAEHLRTQAAKHPDLKIMEAFMYRHHPQWRKTKELVDGGEIGELRTIHSVFAYHNTDPQNIRNMRETGGGGLMDIGCYCVSLARFLFGDEPRRVCCWLDADERFQVDRLGSGLLDFGMGTACFSCSMQMVPYQRVHIFGSTGRIEIEIPFNAPPDRPCRIWHERSGKLTELSFSSCDQYAIQADLFAAAILQDMPVPTSLEDAVANMRVIDALKTSAAGDQWVALT